MTALVERGVAPGRFVAIDRGADDPTASAPRAQRVDYAIHQQRFDPDKADDIDCTPFGVLGVMYTEDEKRARCKH